MPPVTSLINKFETIAHDELRPESKRVRVKRYSTPNMPLRQSTLNFGKAPAIEPKRRSITAAMSQPTVRPPTPPAEEVDNETIVVDISERRLRVPLPTPSESVTDVSSQTSSTVAVKSPPRSRSKRVSSARKSASKETSHAAPAPPAKHQKQRHISGETLLSEPSVSKTSLLRNSIDALDMAWDMSAVFNKPQEEQPEAASDDGSTINVAVEERHSSEENAVKREAKRLRMAENEKKWEQRRKAAEKNATRRSSRASLLVTKATEMVSAVTSSVLGKRRRGKDATSSDNPDKIQEESEPDTKKARVQSPAEHDSIAATSRAITSRPPKEKKWLVSGLYTGQTRSSSPLLAEAKNKRKSQPSTTPMDTPTEPHKDNSVLPLPMFAGARLLESGRDFKLPFDVFSPLPPGQPKPDEWKKVNKNVFVGDAAAEWRVSKFLEHSTCMCKPATGCDADCMNKYMYYECDERNCNLTPERCGNRAFEGLRQRVKKGGKYNVGVEVMRTKDRGYGVRANRTFEPNQIIIEYTGEIITQEECERRMRSEYKDNECYYLMAFDQNMIIDATRGSIARFVNHSCDPNCRMEKWTVGGKPRMALFAGDRGIMTGEELTYDYNFDPYSQKNVQVCRCGSANCRGVLGPRPKELPKEKEKESKLAGAKRKIAEVLEESTHLLNVKKRKTQEEKGRKPLPKGWAYVEPEPKPTKARASEDAARSRQPTKLERMLSQKSDKSAKSKTDSRKESTLRVASTSSGAKLLDDASEPMDRPSTTNNAVASLKAKAGSIKKSVGRSLRGGK